MREHSNITFKRKEEKYDTSIKKYCDYRTR